MEDVYGYKSLLLRLCSPDRFDSSSEPEKVELAVELQGYLKKIEWNDIYDLSKIRKRARIKLGVDVDVAELYSRLMEVFSPEKYRKRGYGTEKVKRYSEICRTLTDAKDDINLLESELYDIAKMDVDLLVEPELDKSEFQEEVGSDENVVEDGLSERDAEMRNAKMEQIDNILISLANSLTEKELDDDDELIGEVFNVEDDIKDDKDENCPVDPKREAKTEIIVGTKVEVKTETVKPPSSSNPPLNNRGMFRRPFSFRGRIRRAEYLLSWVLALMVMSVFAVLTDVAYDSDFLVVLLIFGYVVVFWFLLAQRTKRCHDIGSSGWAQLIPFYEFWILFENSEYGENEYGDCPKKMREI